MSKLKLGAIDHNARLAIENGLDPDIAIQCVTLNPARHMRLTPYVGSLAPGRFADVVLLSDLPSLSIAEVWADGAPVSQGRSYIGPVPAIDWPAWATNTINIDNSNASHQTFVHVKGIVLTSTTSGSLLLRAGRVGGPRAADLPVQPDGRCGHGTARPAPAVRPAIAGAESSKRRRHTTAHHSENP